MRLFIAIDIDETITQKIKNLIADLGGSLRGVRWVREDGIHITLKFLGEVDATKADEVTRSLEQISSRHSAMSINISQLGKFPERGAPRIIWLGAQEDSGALKKLAVDIEEEMRKIGFEKENRDFKPHVTLGRVKRYQQVEKGIPAKWNHEEISFGSFRAEQIFLVKSTLRPDGARYEKIGNFTFREERA
jgi:2'-5' RNA ligase